MPKSVTLYTKQLCPYCRRAKSLLEENSIAFEEIDLTSDDAKRQELQEKTGWMSVPMIFIGEEFIGGAEELERLHGSGELAAKLN